MTPWSWRLDRGAWFDGIGGHLARWAPHPELEMNAEAVRTSLLISAARRDDWLYHPVVCAATLGEPRWERDVRLAVWQATHADADDPLGSLTVPRQTWAWTPEGGQPVEAGQYDLRELCQRLGEASEPPLADIALDVWIDAVGLPLPTDIVSYERWSWAHRRPLDDAQSGRLQGDIVNALRALRALQARLPACADWSSAVTRVIVPLCGTPDTRFRSGSSAALPGLIFSDIDGPAGQLLESLVHESAHLWFCIAEAEEPVIQPDHAELYHSPLRTDPRPLRGIFLAFHALAFMAAFYKDWGTAFPEQKDAADDLAAVLKLRDDAAETVAEQRGALTEHGRHLFDDTVNRVVNYVH